PPLVTGTVITSIGMCLFPVAINWAGGGKGAEDFGSLHFLFLSSLVLCTILLINRFMRGFWVNISVLMGMGLGYAIAGGMGMVDLGGLAE
ncbi:purine permease, partial [Pseudomonas aeruginosa]